MYFRKFKVNVLKLGITSYRLFTTLRQKSDSDNEISIFFNTYKKFNTVLMSKCERFLGKYSLVVFFV